MENNKFIVSAGGVGCEKVESAIRYSSLFTPSSKEKRTCIE